MRKTLTLLLSLIMALSLCACGSNNETSNDNDAPANIVVDGIESTPKDFLIERLSTYIQSEEYLSRTAEFEDFFGVEAKPFNITYAFELIIEDYGNEHIPIHLLMVKADSNYCCDGGSRDSIEIAVDYDTGIIYDQFNVDETWMEKDNKSEAICVAVLLGCFGMADYNGDPFFNDSEVHVPLSESEIAEINQAIRQ